MSNLCSLADVGSFSKLDKDSSGSKQWCHHCCLFRNDLGSPRSCPSIVQLWGPGQFPRKAKPSVNWLLFDLYPIFLKVCIHVLFSPTLHHTARRRDVKKAGFVEEGTPKTLIWPFLCAYHSWSQFIYMRKQAQFSWLPQVTHPIGYNS